MLDRLGRHPLSIILSYLNETEGTSFLLTRKRYAHQLLPIFRLPPSNDDDDSNADALWDDLVVVNDRGERICPVPVTKARKKKNRHKFVVVPVQDPTVLLARLNTRRLCRRRRTRKGEPSAYPIGMSTTELAHWEWSEQRRQHSLSSSTSCFLPCHLQLLRFLDRASPSQADIRDNGLALLVSYPRSGNSLARSLLEQCTGLVTGSDTRPDYDLSKELSVVHGMVGEGVASHRLTFAVKSHWPERGGSAPVPNGKRAIVLSRNPYDAIDSYWNMCATKSHTKTVTDAVYERFRDKYQQLVRNEIDVWLRFHHYWFVTAASQVPVLLVRYEDLVRHPNVELTRMMRFVLQVDELDAYWTSRVNHVVAAGRADHDDGGRGEQQLAQPAAIDNLGSYRPRTGGTVPGGAVIRFGKALRRNPRFVTDDLVQFIHAASERFECNYLKLFGYDALHDGFPDTLPPADAHWMEAVYGRHDRSMPSSLTINDGCAIRPLSCPFGRGMRAWRQSVTDKDQNPLPTVDSGR
jgi:Sulfotransferase domain